MRTGARMAVVAVGLIVVAGCDDQCSPYGATRCSGNSTQLCSGTYSEDTGADNTNHWHKLEDCSSSGTTCIQTTATEAVCIQDTTPDPLCAGVHGYCVREENVRCSGGYRTGELQCDRVDPRFTHCVVAGADNAACVPPDAVRNDACAPVDSAATLSRYSTCAGDVLVQCFAGFAVSTIACRCGDSSSAMPCTGFIGYLCSSDSDCAPGFICHPDWSRCTAACETTDPNAAQHCLDLFVAGGPASSPSSGPPTGGSQLICNAGFCDWVN